MIKLAIGYSLFFAAALFTGESLGGQNFNLAAGQAFYSSFAVIGFALVYSGRFK